MLDARDAAPATAALNLVALGRSEREHPPVVANGELKVHARPAIFLVDNSAAGDLIAQSDAGKDCHLVDDHTVAKTDDTGTRSRARGAVGA